MERYGKVCSNAEVNIDYDKMKIRFKYPNKHPKELVSYFMGHEYFTIYFPLLLGLGWIGLFFTPFAATHLWGITRTFWFYYFCLCIGGLIIIFCYISLLCHLISKRARDKYPVMMSFRPVKKRTVDFRRRCGECWYIYDNKLVVFDYGVVQFKYRNLSNNKIRTIITKTLHPSSHKGEHYKFIIIFTFKRPLRSGTLEYTTTK